MQGNWNGKPAVSKKGSAARAGPGSSTTSSGALKKLMILLLFLMVAGAVKAQGIAVSPDKLSFELFEGEQQQRQLTIFNTNPDKINFNINSSSALSFSQTEGTINAGEQQKITVTSGKLKPGSYNTELQISSEPQENSGISLNLGVAVKAMMLIKEKNPYKAIIGPLMTLTIVIVGLVAYMMFR